MSLIEIQILHVLHVAGALVLMGCTFYAFAGGPESRKKTLMWAGIASLVMLLTGLRMWQGLYHFAPLGWIFVKIVCWLGLSALAGIGYRRRDKVGLLAGLAVLFVVIALIMVYMQPF